MVLRQEGSHKGQNGTVLIIGGNQVFHGAPILAALGAEKSGVDLVDLLVPSSQLTLARNYSVNFKVGTFAGEFLSGRDIKKIVDWSNRVDCVVVGNGLDCLEKPQTMRAVKELLRRSACKKFVLDAGSLHLEVLRSVHFVGKELVITPHRGELQRLSNSKVVELADDCRLTVVISGAQDMIVGFGGNMHINKTGHSIMTKGGTGDVLAGLLGGLMAQGLSGFEAAKEATRVWGEVGEQVFKKMGLLVTVEDLVAELRI